MGDLKKYLVLGAVMIAALVVHQKYVAGKI